jgi:hypothetical protein
MGFDGERRYAAEYNQTPRDKTSVPKESVDRERLLLETAWHKYRPTEGDLMGARSDPRGLTFVQEQFPPRLRLERWIFLIVAWAVCR